jgi:hypothetical protein
VKVALGSDMLASIVSRLSFPGRGGGSGSYTSPNRSFGCGRGGGSGSCTSPNRSFGGLGGSGRGGDIDLDRDSKLSSYRTGCDLVIDGYR